MKKVLFFMITIISLIITSCGNVKSDKNFYIKTTECKKDFHTYYNILDSEACAKDAELHEKYMGKNYNKEKWDEFFNEYDRNDTLHLRYKNDTLRLYYYDYGKEYYNVGYADYKCELPYKDRDEIAEKQTNRIFFDKTTGTVICEYRIKTKIFYYDAEYAKTVENLCDNELLIIYHKTINISEWKNHDTVKTFI